MLVTKENRSLRSRCCLVLSHVTSCRVPRAVFVESCPRPVKRAYSANPSVLTLFQLSEAVRVAA